MALASFRELYTVLVAVSQKRNCRIEKKKKKSVEEGSQDDEGLEHVPCEQRLMSLFSEKRPIRGKQNRGLYSDRVEKVDKGNFSPPPKIQETEGIQ